MKKLRNVICILIAAMLVSASCSTPDDNDSVSSESTTPAETEEAVTELTDELPEEDFEGYTFRIVTGIHGTYPISTFSVEAESGDTLDDALFRRNSEISERFNVGFSENVLGDIFTVNTNVKNAAYSSDDSFDMAMMIDRYALYAGIDGQLYSYNDLPYINLDKPYWDSNMSRDFSIGGKLFFTSGADNLVFATSVTHLIFNKVMTNSYNLGDPYQYVRDGKWTFDKYFEMMDAVTDDIDGDGKLTDLDQYGVISTNNMYWPNLWINSGVKTVNKDENDIPYFSAPTDEKFINILQFIYDYGYSRYPDAWFNTDSGKVKNYTTTGSKYNLSMVMFTAGRSLFCGSSIITILDTRGMDDDFGIIPYPAYEEVSAGTPYGCRTFGGFPYVVPITSSDLERTSIIMEALACASYKQVKPALYDILVKTKVSRDTESEAMLDMMLANRITDLGESYWFDTIEREFEVFFLKSGNNLVSMMEKLKPKADTEIEKAIGFFEKLS